MTRKILPFLLVLIVLSAGCITHSKTENSKFSVEVTFDSYSVPINITAVAVEVKANFMGNKRVLVNSTYPVILIKTSPAVVNASAFKLSDDVYALPYYSFDNPLKMYFLSLRLKNGSHVVANIKISGTPDKRIGMMVTYEVEKNGTYFVVRPIGWSLENISIWGENFGIKFELEEPIQFANAPRAELRNNTYILSSVCTSKEGSTTVTYQYPVGVIYLVGSEGEAFVGKIYFPCEEMGGK